MKQHSLERVIEQVCGETYARGKGICRENVRNWVRKRGTV